MPFTPFHMGPALALKALTGRHFSVLVFGIAQVAMDIEPLVGLIRGSRVLHGWTHTYIGALGIAAVVACVAPPICRPILSVWNHLLDELQFPWHVSESGIGTFPALSGAFIGTLSHVALDSFMHADIEPLRPWSASNGLLGSIETLDLYLYCVRAGVLGMLAWYVRGVWRKRRQRADAAG